MATHPALKGHVVGKNGNHPHSDGVGDDIELGTPWDDENNEGTEDVEFDAQDCSDRNA